MRAIMTDDRLNAARCAWDGDANNYTSRLEVNGTTVARQLMGNPKPVISVNSRWQIPNGVYLGFRFHNGEQFTTLATQRLIQMPDVPAEEWVSLSRSVVVPENAYFMLGTILTMYATSWPKDTWFDISKVSVTRGVNASFFSGDTKGEELLSLSLSTNPSQYGLAA